MTIRELTLKSRSYRRFYGDRKITKDTLMELVDLARNTPSAANRQPLRYKLICSAQENEKVYNCVGWAGYYKDWAGPVLEERPTAYIAIVTDENVNAQTDEGIAGQTILLGAAEKGLGGCFIGNLKKDELKKVLELPENMKVDLVIALGYPKEEVVIEEISKDGDIYYYRDENQVHHVPKRCLEDIIL